MKKPLIALATIFILSAGAVSAQIEESETNSESIEQVTQQEKKEVKKEELPEKVQTALKSDDYKGWTVNKAYETKNGDEMMYEIVLTNGEQKATYTFDEKGNTIS